MKQLAGFQNSNEIMLGLRPSAGTLLDFGRSSSHQAELSE